MTQSAVSRSPWKVSTSFSRVARQLIIKSNRGECGSSYFKCRVIVCCLNHLMHFTSIMQSSIILFDKALCVLVRNMFQNAFRFTKSFLASNAVF